ncbi:MAG: hypothetical protein J0H15_09550 [Xanthomonadales bacterium]|nr:hypothetical protein [Xanthomonadales bacterium]
MRATLASSHPMATMSTALPAARPRDQSDESARAWWLAGLVFCLGMLAVHVAAGLNNNGFQDFWRDMYWAMSIAHGERLPLAGPPVYEMAELGPWWFYLLAAPMALGGGVAAASAFAQALAASKYLIAWRLGIRIADARLGFAFAASLAIAGWSLLPMLFPTHTMLTEAAVLLLAWVAWNGWQRFTARNAVLLGLAAAACLHAHPATAGFVLLAGLVLLWRHRSPVAVGWMAVAALIALASLAPPWLDRSGIPPEALKPAADYLGGDVAVGLSSRIPALLRSVAVGGAWWGLLLMTNWSATAVRVAWWLWCAALVFGLAGLVPLWRRDPQLVRLAGWAALLFVFQCVFVAVLRPITPMWMVPGTLPPLALAVALGWYGWIAASPRSWRWRRRLAMAALGMVIALSLAPFAFTLRDLRAARTMAGVNPFLDVIEQGDRYVKVPVPFYPVSRLDRLAQELCGPAVLHGRLAVVAEGSLGVPMRKACGRWPALHYGGVEGAGPHLAGLLPGMAEAIGFAPDRVVAGMALYTHVRAIAPTVGGTPAPLKRLQIAPESGPGPATRQEFRFATRGADVVVLTNRHPGAAPLEILAVEAADAPVTLLAGDGGSFAYACAGCAPGTTVEWRVALRGIGRNLDLVVLEATADEGSP